jgi:hypothetical protein
MAAMGRVWRISLQNNVLHKWCRIYILLKIKKKNRAKQKSFGGIEKNV